jgi:uncharacterized DUF497 family protein
MASANDPIELLRRSSGFDWDIYNYYKNWQKHGITAEEAQEVFTNQPLLAYEDSKHSDTEQRYLAYGKTNGGMRLFVSYTFRGDKIRIISARKMNQKERTLYEQEG